MEKQTFNPQTTRVVGNLIPDWGEVLEAEQNGTVDTKSTITTSTVTYRGSPRQIINLTKV